MKQKMVKSKDGSTIMVEQSENPLLDLREALKDVDLGYSPSNDKLYQMRADLQNESKKISEDLKQYKKDIAYILDNIQSETQDQISKINNEDPLISGIKCDQLKILVANLIEFSRRFDDNVTKYEMLERIR